MERVGPAGPDKDMFVDAMSTNAESISIEYEHANVRAAEESASVPAQRRS